MASSASARPSLCSRCSSSPPTSVTHRNLGGKLQSWPPAAASAENQCISGSAHVLLAAGLSPSSRQLVGSLFQSFCIVLFSMSSVRWFLFLFTHFFILPPAPPRALEIETPFHLSHIRPEPEMGAFHHTLSFFRYSRFIFYSYIYLYLYIYPH